jgi:hypothetical protein
MLDARNIANAFLDWMDGRGVGYRYSIMRSPRWEIPDVRVGLHEPIPEQDSPSRVRPHSSRQPVPVRDNALHRYYYDYTSLAYRDHRAEGNGNPRIQSRCYSQNPDKQ